MVEIGRIFEGRYSQKNIDIYSEEKIKHIELYKKMNNIDYDL